MTTPKGDCVCTEFDDGSSFTMSSFAGGGAKEGAFSHVTCTFEQPRRDAEHIHYTRTSLIERKLAHAGRCDSKTSVLEDAGGDVLYAIDLLDTALDAARQAAFKCCTRNAWGDGEHDATCPKRLLEAKIAELERRLKLAGYYGDAARLAEFADVESRIDEAEARAAGYAQRIVNARRELDGKAPPHGDGG